ncbi:alpha/beta hydrolase [Nocardia sp. NPDC004568]|uniref:alpha/beta fold hydrolase n=1 Tax=Nocardia sp. NPDC004568 TaxID=3154551 RepID=UPI0033BCE3F4
MGCCGPIRSESTNSPPVYPRSCRRPIGQVRKSRDRETGDPNAPDVAHFRPDTDIRDSRYSLSAVGSAARERFAAHDEQPDSRYDVRSSNAAAAGVPPALPSGWNRSPGVPGDRIGDARPNRRPVFSLLRYPGPVSPRHHLCAVEVVNEKQSPQRSHPRLRWRSAVVEGRPARYAVGGLGPRVLFLHGWGIGGRPYARPLEQLVRMGMRVYSPALPGFGGTAGLPVADRTLAGYAQWVGHFAETVDLARPVTVVGHSFGGGVAIKAAHDLTDLAERLVLVNSIGGSAWTDGRGVVRALRERPLWDWGLHLQADLLPRRQVTRVLPVILREAMPNMLRHPTGVWETAHLARTADLASELTALAERRLPIFVVWSARDTVIPESTSMSLRTALGDPHAITVPGGHTWLMSDPHAFGELITNVIREPVIGPDVGADRTTAE